MTWTEKDFEEHRKEWEKNPIMEEKEILEYFGINRKKLQKLVKTGKITQFKGKIFDRYEIIAYHHETVVRPEDITDIRYAPKIMGFFPDEYKYPEFIGYNGIFLTEKLYLDKLDLTKIANDYYNKIIVKNDKRLKTLRKHKTEQHKKDRENKKIISSIYKKYNLLAYKKRRTKKYKS